jgi:hypothetical protein
MYSWESFLVSLLANSVPTFIVFGMGLKFPAGAGSALAAAPIKLVSRAQILSQPTNIVCVIVILFVMLN